MSSISTLIRWTRTQNATTQTDNPSSRSSARQQIASTHAACSTTVTTTSTAIPAKRLRRWLQAGRPKPRTSSARPQKPLDKATRQSTAFRQQRPQTAARPTRSATLADASSSKSQKITTTRAHVLRAQRKQHPQPSAQTAARRSRGGTAPQNKRMPCRPQPSSASQPAPSFLWQRPPSCSHSPCAHCKRDALSFSATLSKGQKTMGGNKNHPTAHDRMPQYRFESTTPHVFGHAPPRKRYPIGAAC